MINLQKEIIFRDGISLDNGRDDLTDDFLDNVEHMCDLGTDFGLSLDKFEITDELVYFEWRGTKYDMLKYYTYYSKNMTTESLDKRKETQLMILNK